MNPSVLHIQSMTAQASNFAMAVRGHWGIENSLHWVLDMVIGDDQCRIRKDHSPENMTVIKQMATNLLGKTPSRKSPRVKRKLAAWNDGFLKTVLQGA
ncbi:MAG: ISAs1 family transposase [Magnetococcus sp. WYHC-3]